MSMEYIGRDFTPSKAGPSDWTFQGSFVYISDRSLYPVHGYSVLLSRKTKRTPTPYGRQI